MGRFFFFQAEDGIRDDLVTGVQTCALPISRFYCCTTNLSPRGISRFSLSSTAPKPRGLEFVSAATKLNHSFVLGRPLSLRNPEGPKCGSTGFGWRWVFRRRENPERFV